MIPVNLQLSGFLSYQERVSLDFTNFDVACISGSNGAGKSSLLDAITWALFGQARRRDDALINSHAQAAEVVFDFFYEGNLFRVQRSKPREKSTVLEFYVCDGDSKWRALTEKSMRETEARIQSTLRMDYETFINASFLLQGKADQFAQQRPSDRKRVLSAILGLEMWEQYRVSAFERRRTVEQDLKSVDAQIEEIDAELSQEDARKARLAEVETRLEHLNLLRKDKEEGLKLMQRLAATLEEQRRLVDVLAQSARETRDRFDRLRNQLDVLCQEREEYQQVLAGEAEAVAAYQRWQDLRAELARWDTVAANFREVEARRAGPLTAITAEASRLDMERRGLFTQELAVLQEQSRLPEIETQWGQLTEAIERLQVELSRRGELEADLQSVQERTADARAENGTLKEAMRALKERINRLNQVEGADCPLCGQPLSPEERSTLVSDLESEGKIMGDRYRANQEWQAQSEARLRELQVQISGLGRYEEDLRKQVRQCDRLEAERQRISDAVQAWAEGGAARLAEITRMLAEEDFAHEARTILSEIDAQSLGLGYNASEHDAVRRDELAGRSAEDRMRALESARASLAPLERQIGGLETQASIEMAQVTEQDEAYRQANERYAAEAARLPDVNLAEREMFEMQAEENRLRMEVGMVRQLVTVLATQRDRRARLATRRETLSMQIARLKTLERAFSKDGVPALLIEQALPEIETHANEILDRLSSGSMAVRFETQRQYKDKHRDDRRETLDIIISDGAGEREYELFSGGEAFRVNFAIRLALSRVLAQRAGARLQTLVIDEGFGSQDAEGRQRLIEAINLVRPEFAKVLVITHLEELKEAFPARIAVEKTPQGSQVAVVN
jgi:DNA repair protein SbcC/Rad50